MKGTIQLKRKLQSVGSSLMLTIPRQLALLKEWKKGDTITISEKEGRLLIYKES
jgi:hypothetical protein